MYLSNETENTMRFAIIDDLDKERARALKLFEEYRDVRHVSFLIDDSSSSEDFLASFVPYTYDIILWIFI
jgi:hypothetical protein